MASPTYNQAQERTQLTEDPVYSRKIEAYKIAREKLNYANQFLEELDAGITDPETKDALEDNLGDLAEEIVNDAIKRDLKQDRIKRAEQYKSN